MKTILSAAQMKRADERAVLQGVPSLVLMERAALAVVQELLDRKDSLDLRRICIFCGTGNNAGDGVAVGRILKDYGYDATLILTGPVEKFSEAMVQQVVAAKNRGVRMISKPSPSVLAHATLFIDALFGIGLTREVTGIYAEAVRLMNEAEAPVVAVDLPSGIHTDTGAVMGTAVRASLTVTFAREKRGLLLHPGAAFAGEIAVKEIGIPVPSELVAEEKVCSCEERDLTLLRSRDEAGNKGTFGKVLVIAGSESICGAAILCAEAAMRAGAGMVKLYTEESNRTAVSARLPEALVSVYREGQWTPGIDGIRLLEDFCWADGVVIGPGIGTGSTAMSILMYFLDWNSRNGKKPVVFDADALNLLAESPTLMKQICFPAVFTPHMGEMARLDILPVRELKEDPVSAAVSFSERYGVTLVLKDARTVAAVPSGDCWINTRGNSALASAGSGDVLAGIMGTLLTQNPDLPETAALAVLIHALAGERAAEKTSRSGVIAGDLLQEIAAVMPE